MNIHICLITLGAIKPRLVSAYAREKLKGIGRAEVIFFFLNSEICRPPTQNVPATIAYISGYASRRAIPVEFSSERHLRPRNMYIRIYVWHMHAACRRPSPCAARTFLSVGMYVYVCMRVCLCLAVYAPNDDPSLFGSATQPGCVAITRSTCV